MKIGDKIEFLANDRERLISINKELVSALEWADKIFDSEDYPKSCPIRFAIKQALAKAKENNHEEVI